LPSLRRCEHHRHTTPARTTSSMLALRRRDHAGGEGANLGSDEVVLQVRRPQLRAGRHDNAVVELVERDLVLKHDHRAARVLRQGPGRIRIALLALDDPALGVNE